jgi:hypothetical protein
MTLTNKKSSEHSSMRLAWDCQRRKSIDDDEGWRDIENC